MSGVSHPGDRHGNNNKQSIRDAERLSSELRAALPWLLYPLFRVMDSQTPGRHTLSVRVVLHPRGTCCHHHASSAVYVLCRVSPLQSSRVPGRLPITG